MEPINILVTLDKNYIPPLRVMLKSLFLNNPKEVFHIYLIHDAIPCMQINSLKDYCAYYGSLLRPIAVGEEMFADAPALRYLTKAMYYRLLACNILPADISKALYLDPDTLVINPIRKLYDADLTGYLFGGCIHSS